MCMVPCTQERSRGETIYCARLFVGEIQVGEINKVFRANNRIGSCTIPEYTNESLVKAKWGGDSGATHSCAWWPAGPRSCSW